MSRKLLARKRRGRPINGILVLDKPTGMTSNSALQKVKRLFQAQKAGHTGSLDPLATGVLPICLGESTKVSHFLLDADKRYRAKCTLGSVTTTGDSDGEVLECYHIPELNKERLLTLLKSFQGSQKQTPPMYSALKYNGRPLYEYARKGIEVERKSRNITIFAIKLLAYSFISTAHSEQAFIEIEVHCSKGTYIRSLCEEIGQAIGCGAYISALRRLESGPFALSQSITLDSLSENYALYSTDDPIDKLCMDELLLPTDIAITHLPAVNLEDEQFVQIRNGLAIVLNDPIQKAVAEPQDYRLYYNKILIGLAILDESGTLKPKRLLFL